MHVLCVGMIRSGSTWQYQIAAALVERCYRGRRLGFVEYPLDAPGWAVLKWHEPQTELAELLATGQARALYCYRDLRDVAFSMAYKINGTFEDVIAGGYLEHAIAADAFWSAQPGTLVQRYEDIIRAPGMAVEQIAAMLGLELDIGDTLGLADAYSLSTNAVRQQQIASAVQQHGIDARHADAALLYDPTTLLHHNHIRTGAAGGWRHEATPEQRRRLDAVVGNWLIERGYEPDHAWVEA